MWARIQHSRTGTVISNWGLRSLRFAKCEVFLKNNWQKVRQIIAAIPDAEELVELFQSIGAPA